MFVAEGVPDLEYQFNWRTIDSLMSLLFKSIQLLSQMIGLQFE